MSQKVGKNAESKQTKIEMCFVTRLRTFSWRIEISLAFTAPKHSRQQLFKSISSITVTLSQLTHRKFLFLSAFYRTRQSLPQFSMCSVAMEALINQQQIDLFLKQHEGQLRASGVPEHLFKAIAVKLENGIFDAGEFFQLLLIEYDEGERDDKDPVFAVQALKDIKASDENAVFLIDHALTFKADGLRKQLEETPSMVNRLGIMMGLDDENKNLDTVMQHIWRYSNFYTINAQGR